MSFPSRSKCAFLNTAESLWRPGARVYFWTVTFREVQSDWVQSKRFTRFLDHLKRYIHPGIGGVKVAELHPGGHGIHYHLLVNMRISVELVRRVGRVYGVGRIHVQVADQNSCGYLSKYLSKKGMRPFCESGRKMRSWAAFGKIPHRCRCSDLVFESPMWDYRRARGYPAIRAKWYLEGRLGKCWQRGELAFRLGYQAVKYGDLGLLSKIADEAGNEVVADGPWGDLRVVTRFVGNELNCPF